MSSNSQRHEISNADFSNRARAVCDAATDVKMFPVQDGPDVPWAIAAQHEKQFQKNHYQTMQRLSERGGLGITEMLHVLYNENWHSEFTAKLKAKTNEELLEMLQQFVAKRSYLPQLEAFRTALPEALDRLEKLDRAYNKKLRLIVEREAECERLRGEVERLEGNYQAGYDDAMQERT